MTTRTSQARKPWLLILALLAAFALIAGACGSDDDDESGNEGTTAPAEPGEDPPPPPPPLPPHAASVRETRSAVRDFEGVNRSIVIRLYPKLDSFYLSNLSTETARNVRILRHIGPLYPTG